MKLFAILVLVVGFYYGEAQYCVGERFKGVAEKCLIAEKANKNDLNDFLELKEARNENANCLRACILKECKCMNASGNFDRLVIKEYIPRFVGKSLAKQRRVGDIVGKCVSEAKVEGNPCKTTEDYISCFVRDCKNCFVDLFDALEISKF